MIIYFHSLVLGIGGTVTLSSLRREYFQFNIFISRVRKILAWWWWFFRSIKRMRNRTSWADTLFVWNQYWSILKSFGRSYNWYSSKYISLVWISWFQSFDQPKKKGFNQTTSLSCIYIFFRLSTFPNKTPFNPRSFPKLLFTPLITSWCWWWLISRPKWNFNPY